MKKITLENIRDTLRDLTNQVQIPANQAENALKPIENYTYIY